MLKGIPTDLEWNKEKLIDSNDLMKILWFCVSSR